jgi:hypothetical protein
VILHCTFEELSALESGGRRALDSFEHGAGVVAPPQALADIEALLPRLEGDLAVSVLAEQQSLARALSLILGQLREKMDRIVLEQHAAAEEAILTYFEYANVLTVYDRVRQMGSEMAAMIELITGAAPTAESAAHITFPD